MFDFGSFAQKSGIRGCFLRLDLVDEKMREGKPLPYEVADILLIADRFSWWLYADEHSSPLRSGK